MGMGSAEYQVNIYKGLQRAYSNPSERMTAELSTLRLVLFSDLHRGVRDGADDFQRCERSYNAALAYYLSAGYTLCLLGDAEELWECRPKPIIEKYKHSFALERKYGTRLGEFFFVHGHQGTADSEKYSGVSRLAVRYVWRNFQRLTKLASTTPAKDWTLRQKHDAAMYQWALAKRDQGLILFTGHTHRPVFMAESLVDRLTRELAALESQEFTPELQETRRALEAELEWARSSEFQAPAALNMEAPCYFNTGCCSFSDGTLTALTIADGKIQLERWPDNVKKPRPQVLASGPVDLRRCFAEVKGERYAPGARVVPQPRPSPAEEAVLH